MQRLTIFLLVAVVCLAGASAMSFAARGHGGKTESNSGENGTGGKSGKGGKSDKGGKSQGGSSAAGDFSKDDLIAQLEKLKTAFTDAADALERVETLGDEEKWDEMGTELENTYTTYLGKLEPAVDGLGDVLEKVSENPDEFPREDYCESSVDLAEIADTYTDLAQLGADWGQAIVEDMGCFKGKMRELVDMDTSLINANDYGERHVYDDYFDLITDAIFMGQGWDRLEESWEKIFNVIYGGGSSSGSTANVENMDKLIRYLKSLNLDLSRRRK